MSLKIKIKTIWITFKYSLSFLLLFFYLIVAFLFLFTNAWGDLITEKRELIGLIILAFATLRFFVSYKRYRFKKVKINAKKKEKIVEEVE